MSDSFYLLKVSIGPVQEFIKEARKIKDLWVGSSLLSRVTYEALRPFINNKCEVIFPIHDSFNKTGSLPNHFLVKVPSNKFNDFITELQKFDSFWKNIAQDVYNQIQSDFNKFCNTSAQWDTQWNSQVNDFWEYYWVAVPLDNADYGSVAKRVQRLLDERKLTRTFNQWQGSNAEKCTQCGHREVLGPEKQSENREFWNKIKQDNKYKYIFKKGDRLCAICTIKRLLTADNLNNGLQSQVFKEVQYESTRDIAVRPFVELIKVKSAPSLKDDFINKCIKLGSKLNIEIKKENEVLDKIPSIFFYKDELNPKNLAQEYFPDLYLDKKTIDQARQKESEIKPEADALKTTLIKIEDELKTEPTKYYALVAMDGDNIGKWLYELETQADQTEKSKKLSEMAKIMTKINNSRWQGQYIYAGGDDLLAFGPVEQMLKTCAQIRRIFLKKVGKTASIGIVITHYTNPLRKDLELVRENLEKAKEEYGRDALVIAIHLSSESIIEFGSKWDISVNGTQKSFDTIIREFLSLFNLEKLKIGFIFDLIKELRACYWVDNHRKYFLKEIFELEALRLYKRHRPGFNQLPQSEKDKELNIINSLTILADPNTTNYLEDNEKNIINFLRTVAFLYRENIKEF